MDATPQRITQTLKGLLWLVFIPSLLFAIYMLFVGLTFGFALWDASNPTPTILWLGVLAVPLLLGAALKKARRSPLILAAALLAACVLESAYVVTAFSH